MENFSASGALPVNDLFDFLEGNWRLSRTLNDLRQNMPGVMSGQVEIKRKADRDAKPTLGYREEGELQFGDYHETVTRCYEFSFPEPHLAWVCFEDGRVFHQLDLSNGYWEDAHQCGEDLYQGRFRVSSHDVWLSNWFVSGPAKELVLDNHYQRIYE